MRHTSKFHDTSAILFLIAFFDTSLNVFQESNKEKGPIDVYWRESLWNFTESLGVNFGVMMLVLLDLTNVLVSVITNEDSGIFVCVCVRA